jgi:hypothetical protein
MLKYCFLVFLKDEITKKIRLERLSVYVEHSDDEVANMLNICLKVNTADQHHLKCKQLR